MATEIDVIPTKTQRRVELAFGGKGIVRVLKALYLEEGLTADEVAQRFREATGVSSITHYTVRWWIYSLGLATKRPRPTPLPPLDRPA